MGGWWWWWVGGGGGVVVWWWCFGGGVQSHNHVKPNSVELSEVVLRLSWDCDNS